MSDFNQKPVSKAADSAVQVGVGLRHQHYQNALESASPIDFVEVHSENFFAKGGVIPSLLEQIQQTYPLSLHGTSLGLGSASGIRQQYLDRLAELVQQAKPTLVSDHASFSWTQNAQKFTHAGDLLPLDFDLAHLQVICANVNQVQQQLGRQILVENIVSYLPAEASAMSETDFLQELAHRTGCGLLIDLNNVLVNAQNRQQPSPLQAAKAWVCELSPSLIGEIHLAGYTPVSAPNLIVDDHSQPVSEQCWALYQHTISLTGPIPTLIEWDNNLPDWSVLIAEAQKARAIQQRLSKSEDLVYAA